MDNLFQLELSWTFHVTMHNIFFSFTYNFLFGFDVDFSFCWLNLEVSWYSLEQNIWLKFKTSFHLLKEEVYSSRWKLVLNFNQMFCSREYQLTSKLFGCFDNNWVCIICILYFVTAFEWMLNWLCNFSYISCKILTWQSTWNRTMN